MRKLQLIAFVLLPGCFCWPCEEARPPSVFTEEYKPFKQPNRDPGYPAMVTVRDEGDGTYWEMMRSMANGYKGKPFEWGKRYKVEVTSRYNRVTQFSDRSITDLIAESEDADEPFRLHSSSAPYFGEDKRSFIDGKAFKCESDDVCAKLDAAILGGKRFDMVMHFGTPYTAPLVLDSVESPTCYALHDCTVRQACCDQGDAFVCVADDACPPDKDVGVVRADYLKRRAGPQN